jgi:hypothetical protein
MQSVKEFSVDKARQNQVILNADFCYVSSFFAKKKPRLPPQASLNNEVACLLRRIPFTCTKAAIITLPVNFPLEDEVSKNVSCAKFGEGKSNEDRILIACKVWIKH